MKTKKEIDNIIEILSLRKKSFVTVRKSLIIPLFQELSKSYPLAKVEFFSGGRSYQVRRKSSSKTLIKSN